MTLSLVVSLLRSTGTPPRWGGVPERERYSGAIVGASMVV